MCDETQEWRDYLEAEAMDRDPKRLTRVQVQRALTAQRAAETVNVTEECHEEIHRVIGREQRKIGAALGQQTVRGLWVIRIVIKSAVQHLDKLLHLVVRELLLDLDTHRACLLPVERRGEEEPIRRKRIRELGSIRVGVGEGLDNVRGTLVRSYRTRTGRTPPTTAAGSVQRLKDSGE